MNPENLRKIIELRHALHREPELSMQEVETGKRLREFLRENTSFSIVEEDGWFYAVKKGANPRHGTESEAGSIAFRADMDALPMDEEIDLPYGSVHPGVSHKCGHDGHCAALCGLALELEQASDEVQSYEINRTVYLIFQKAEEIGRGGELGAELLREEGISEVYAFHNLSGYPEGSIVYRRGLTQPASEGLTIRFFGKQSHASAPEEGINPSGVIAETVRFIEELQHEVTQSGAPRRNESQVGAPQRKELQSGAPQRSESQANEPQHGAPQAETMQEKSHRGMALCTITGLRAGSGDFGISAGEGSLMVTLRAEEEDVMREMERRIRFFAGERSAERGIRTEFEVCDRFPETRNSAEGIERVLCAAEALQAPAIEMQRLWRASEDFGHYLKVCPGAMFYVGNGREWPAVHTAEYDFNDRILERAVDIFVKIVRR